MTFFVMAPDPTFERDCKMDEARSWTIRSVSEDALAAVGSKPFREFHAQSGPGEKEKGCALLFEGLSKGRFDGRPDESKADFEVRSPRLT